MKVQEGELEFDFTAAKAVEKLDDQTKIRPEGMKLVDFVVEEENLLVLVEIKDPSCKGKSGSPGSEAVIEKGRAEFIKKVQNDSLIVHDLTPKARDSYSYLHLMKRDGKPMLYVFVLGAEKLSLDPALLLSFKDRLLAKLRQETDQPWSRHYVTDCLVLTEQTWSNVFPQYPFARVR